MREYDLTIATENVFAELLDLQASESLELRGRGARHRRAARGRATTRCGSELTAEEEFSSDEMWRIEQRIERLNDLGFDVDELDIVTDFDGDQVRIQPKVVEAGHHQRELQGLTGLHVEDAQARRLLNDIASYTAHFDLGREDRHLVANRWLDRDLRAGRRDDPARGATGKLEPAEVFHEVLAHRWYLSEQAGHDVDTFDAAARLHRQPPRATPRGAGRRRGLTASLCRVGSCCGSVERCFRSALRVRRRGRSARLDPS